MSSFTFTLALALAIACISFGSIGAAPAVTNSSCLNECNLGEYCDENSDAPSCTPCLNCAHYNREAPPDSCAKSVAECGEEIPDNHPAYDENEYDGGNGASETELDPGARQPTVGPENPPTIKPDVTTEKDIVGGGYPSEQSSEGTEKTPTMEPEFTTDKVTNGGNSSEQSTDYVRIYLVTTGILAAIVAIFVCVLGRRHCSLNRGSWTVPQIRRSGKRSTAHVQNVPEGKELHKAGVDRDIDFYDQNDRQPSGNERNAALVRLLENTLHPPAAAQAKAQQPSGSNRLNEASVCLDPNGALKLYADNIPERRHAGDAEMCKNMNEAASAEEEQEDDDGFGIEFETHWYDEPQLESDNDEKLAGNADEFGNDFGVSDNDKEYGTERDIPQSPSSPARQTPQSAENDPVARISNSHPHLLQTLNP